MKSPRSRFFGGLLASVLVVAIAVAIPSLSRAFAPTYYNAGNCILPTVSTTRGTSLSSALAAGAGQNSVALMPCQIALSLGHIMVGDVNGLGSDVAMIGDASINSSGALSLVNTGVVPGIYTNANVSVDAKGRITSIASGSGGVGGPSGGFTIDANRNMFAGTAAGTALAGGWENLFAGVNAGSSDTTGSHNMFMGIWSGNKNTSGTDNVFLGPWTGQNNTTGGQGVFIGRDAGLHNTTGMSNVFLGYDAGQQNTTGSNNVFTGMVAGISNTTGSNNIFSGYYAGSTNTTGSQNIFMGYAAGQANTSGNRNIAIGTNAGYLNATGSDNVFIGNTAGASNQTGLGNTFVGLAAGQQNVSANSNSFFGAYAGHNTTIGLENSFFGINAGTQNINGTYNTFFGAHAGEVNRDGSGNVYIGYQAGDFDDNGVFTPSNLYHATAIGYKAQAAVSNTMILGGTGVNAVNVGMGTTNPADKLEVNGDVRVANCIKNAGGQEIAGTCSSDERLKKNIQPITGVLGKVLALQPVTYQWRSGEFPQFRFGDQTNTGLIAQQVEQTLPELVAQNVNGYKAVNYSALPMFLLEALKEQATQIQMIAAKTGTAIADAVVTFKDIVADTLTAKKVKTDQLCMDDVCLTPDQLKVIVGAIKNGTLNTSTAVTATTFVKPTFTTVSVGGADVVTPEKSAVIRSAIPIGSSSIQPSSVLK